MHYFGLLVYAFHILLQDCITPNQIDAADLILKDYLSLLPELYGEKSCTANAHLQKLSNTSCAFGLTLVAD